MAYTRNTRIDVGPHRRRNWIIIHVGRVRMRTILVEADGWLLSGIEELTILRCSFLTLVANK